MRHIAFVNDIQNFIEQRAVKEIIGAHQCGFRRNRPTLDHIFCIRQILERKKNGKTTHFISYS